MPNLGFFVVKYRKLIMILYLIILIPAGIGYLATGVNYDMMSYMPSDMNSRQGEIILEKEFALSGLGLMMAEGKNNYQIEKLIDQLTVIDGVDDVVWLGDYTDIYIPAEFSDPDLVGRFTTADTVLLQIKFSDNARSISTSTAVNEIRTLVAESNGLYFGGEPAILAEMQSAVDEEMLIYTAVAVIMIIIVLTISTSLFLDPVLFLLAVGVAIIINMGSNLVQGEISFLTASIAAVMQLGISLDYAIFLMHRLEEEKDKSTDIETAMITTVNKTAVTISSSALTTIGGFAALMFMQNGIGSDMGFVLGKGIVISLIVTLTLLPGMIITFYPFSSRYRHRLLLPSFKRIAGLLIKYRTAILIFFLIVAVPAYLGQKKVEFYYSNENYLPRDSAAVADTEAIMEEYGAVDMIYLIMPDQGRRVEHELIQKLEQLNYIDSTVAIAGQVDPALPDLIIPEEITGEFTSGRYRNIMIFLKPDLSEADSFTAVDLVRREAARVNSEYYAAGPTAMTRDMASLSRQDARTVALISVLAIGIIIASSLKSAVLPVVLVLAVQMAIWINISILYYQDQTVSSLTPIIIGAIQLGATVDYAILYTLRYRENLTEDLNKIRAAVKTLEDTGRSIMTSAMILFSATFSISLIAGIKTTREMTMLIGRGALVSMLIMYTLLPALLIFTDRLIARTTIAWPTILPKPLNRKDRKVS